MRSACLRAEFPQFFRVTIHAMNSCETRTGPGLFGITSEGGTGNRRTFITNIWRLAGNEKVRGLRSSWRLPGCWSSSLFGMSDIGLTVPSMIEPLRRYDVTVTIDGHSSHFPNPAEFAVAAERAASARTASIVSAHTASQVVSVVTVLAADQPAAVVVALAVVADALNPPAAMSTCPLPSVTVR